MPWYYGNITDTILRSGIEPDDLFYDDEDLQAEGAQTAKEKLSAYTEKLLIKAKDYMDFYTNNEFEELQENRSPLVDDIAERIASRMLNMVTKDQTNQILEVGQFNAELIQDQVLTQSIKQDLDMLPSGSQKVKNRGSIAVGIVTDEDDFDFYTDL